MSRPRTAHRCRHCGTTSSRWAGRCNSCGEWNSLEREPATGRQVTTRRAVLEGGPEPLALADVDLTAAVPRPTGLAELDRVLGGGLVPGSVTLVGGEPGVGKSTLLLQVLRQWATHGAPVLLVCAEESVQQVRLRAERMGPLPERLMLLATTDVDTVVEACASTAAALVVVDSIQTVRDLGTGGAAGSLSQIRACAEAFVTMAKSCDVPVVLVGHVTKEGSLAGPRLLEHVVDTVLTVEGDRHHALRTLRASKHRFGPTGELGLLQMGEAGLGEVPDPHRLLLGDRRAGEPGTIVLPTVDGHRALLVEVQALVSPPGAAKARRQTQGIEAGRLTMLLAVLASHGVKGLPRCDVFVSVVGGIRVTEPAADLALCMAVASATTRRALPADLVAFGEVGLGGEVRQVPGCERRLAEAARLGFRYALVPRGCPEGPPDIRLLRIAGLDGAVSMLHD